MRKYTLLLVVAMLLGACGRAEPVAQPPAATAAIPPMAMPASPGGPATPRPAVTTSPLSDPYALATVPVATPAGPASGLATVPPLPPSANGGEADPRVVAEAQARLARLLQVAAEGLELVDSIAVDWPDGSLGCPQPDVMYLQVIIPGFQIRLRADRGEYVVHTDLQGQQIVWCDNGQPRPLLP